MLHFLSPSPAYFPERLRELLRANFYKAHATQTYEVGPINWSPSEGVFENLPFHKDDNPYYFETSGGRPEPGERKSTVPSFNQRPVLFMPAFTIFHKGTALHLVYTSEPSAAELQAIDTFYKGYAYTVWQADLLAGEALHIQEIASQ